MAVKPRLEIDSDEFALGLSLSDGVMTAYLFWGSDLTLEGETEPQLSVEQRLMFTDESPKLLLCCGRKQGKSILLESRILRIAISHDDTGSITEGMVTTPRQSDMELLYGSRIIPKFHSDPLIMSLIAKELGGEKPQLWFRNNFVWHFRIEGAMGKDDNMRGLRCMHILGDEQQGSNWPCHDSRKMSALPGCTFLYCGVPDGVRSSPFFALDQTKVGDGWSKHKYSSFINPIYKTEEMREQLAKDFGGKNSVSYLTQVLGMWGDETISSFPPGSIAIRQDLPIFVKQYTRDHVSPYAATENYGFLFSDIPSIRCYSYVCGIDFGATSDPTVMTWAFRSTATAAWCEYLRITFNGVEFPYIVGSVLWVNKNLFRGHLTGLGSDNVSLVQAMTKAYGDNPDAQRVFWSNPSGTTMEVDEYTRQPKSDSDGQVLKVRNKQFFTELFRRYMMNAILDKSDETRLWLGNDVEIVEQLRDTIERKTPGGYVVYMTNRTYRGGYIDHALDSLRYACDAVYRGLIIDVERYSDADILEALGFVGGEPASMPWESEKVSFPL